MMLHTVALRPMPESAQLTTINSTHIKALLSALEAAKRFMDALLSFPASDYHLISFSEWMRLPNVMMTVAKLCIPTNAYAAAGWDVKAAHEIVRLDMCIESLCYRFQNQTTYDKIKQPHPDFWWAMLFVSDLTRVWYVRKIKPQTQSNTCQGPTTSDNAADTVSGSGSGAMSTPLDEHAQCQFADLANTDFSSMDMGFGISEDDPFACFKSMDFDMEQIFDMGIWGDEAYNGMGFGSGGMCF
jgi:hypothetical protein